MACSSCSQNNHVTSTTNSNQTFCDCACGCNEVVCPVLQPCTEVIDSNCVIYTGEDVACNEETIINQNDTLNNTLLNIFNYFCNQFSEIEPIPTSANIGDQIGGGIVVAVFNDNGVAKALIASLANVSAALPWTIPPYDIALIGATAQSWSDGLSNTNAIIAQTGATAAPTYAAGAARLWTGGSYNDWYLPSAWELDVCFNSAAIVNKVLGSTNGFISIGSGLSYKSSTEANASTNYSKSFIVSTQGQTGKGSGGPVRAVRIHTL